jgi:hypothetical protein
MSTDPIVDDLHRLRREHAERFHGDFAAMIEDIRRESREQGLKTVSRPARKAIKARTP